MRIDIYSKPEQEWIRILSRYWKMSEEELLVPFKVIAQFRKSPKNDKNNREYGYFEDVRNLNGDLLYFPLGLGPVRIWANYKNTIDNGQFWLINVALASYNDRVLRNNPFLLKMENYIVGKPKLKFSDKLNKEKLIRTIFKETGATVRDARNTSRALQSIMGDLYTETERFVYELLQNADDQPQNNSLVNVTLKTLTENFLFLHTGKPFTEADVESLSSIGDSTKANDSEKTGYKGIGFKSVFSDAETVYIDSGNFSFAYDKHSPLYPSNANMDDKPWQIKPIWQERYRLPTEVQEEPKYFSSPVGIALNVGSKNIEGYQQIVPNLLSHPCFALFLRNIGNIFYEQGNKNVIEINKTINDNIVILTHRKDGIETKEEWIIKDFIIPIPPETREALQSEKLVPAKLKEALKTKISFAVKVRNGRIEQVDDAVLYTYLPTKVDNFGFCFLINADFLTTASRETIHVKNIWNRFLFENIGRLLVEWISLLKEFDDVLTLLPLVPRDEDNILWNDFYESFKSSLLASAFIKGHNGTNVGLDGVILDETGLSHIIGNQLFCDIVKTPKVLPFSLRDGQVLKHEIFNEIEKIEFSDLIDRLIDCTLLTQWFETASEDDREKLYKWINENNINDHSAHLCQLVSHLPLFTFSAKTKTIAEIEENGDVIITEDIIPIKDLLIKIGFSCSDNEITEQHLLYKFIKKQEASELFNRISQADFSILESAERKALFLGLKSINGIGESKLKAIPLFRNLKKEFKPLGEMVGFRDQIPEWLKSFVLHKDDNFEGVDSYLVSKKDEFDEIIQKHINDLNVSLYELYATYKDDWKGQFTKQLIDERESEEILPIVENSDPSIKEYFLNSIQRIDLSTSSVYDADSFEFRTLQLAVSVLVEPSAFSRKVFYKGTPLSDFTIKDEVLCKWTQDDEKRQITLSLAKILPKYQKESEAIDQIKKLFKKSTGIDKLFEAKSMSLNQIVRSLEDKDFLGLSPGYWPTNKRGNAIQYLFYVYYYRGVMNYTSTWVIYIKLEEETQEFVYELLDFLYTNKLEILKSPFTYRLTSYFRNKFLDNPYLLDNEKLLPAIEAWADTEDKKVYLRKNGVHDVTHRSIVIRKKFVENLPIDDIESYAEADIKSFLDYLASTSFEKPFIKENQITNLVALRDWKKRVLLTEINILQLQKDSIEWNSKEYKKWIENHYLSIFIYPDLFPMKLIYQNQLLTEFVSEDLDYYYDKPNKRLYLCANKEIDSLLLKIVKEKSADLSIEDYQLLCLSGKVLISSEELEAKNRRIEALEKQLAEKDCVTSARMVRGETSGLSRAEQCDAQLEAQKFLMHLMPHWDFPDGYGECDDKDVPRHFSTISATKENGEIIYIVLKSYKNQGKPFKVNPEEWDYIIKENAHLFIYDGICIREIEPLDLIMNQPNISITFSTENLDIEERINIFAEALHYFKDLHFDFESFVITKRAKSIQVIYNTIDGLQAQTNDSDL